MGRRRSTKSARREVAEKTDGRVFLIGEFTRVEDKHVFGCFKRLNNWEARFHNITRGGGCPKCKSSKGESKIRSFLLKSKIDFEEQKDFDECVDKRKLRFDFFCQGRLIELQGGQHYKAVSRFGGDERFESQQRKDQIKRDYCAKNNIPLLEIRYDDKDWENKIIEFLK